MTQAVPSKPVPLDRGPGATSLAIIGMLDDPVASYVQAWRRLLANTGNDASGAILPAHVVLAGPVSLDAAHEARVVRAVEQGARGWTAVRVHLRGVSVACEKNEHGKTLLTLGIDGIADHEYLGQLRRAARRWLGCDGGTEIEQTQACGEDGLFGSPSLGAPLAFIDESSQAAATARELQAFAARTSIGAVAVVKSGNGGHVWTPVPLHAGAGSLPWDRAQAGKVFLMRDGMVLLGLRRADRAHRHPGAWDALGGTREAQESLLAALARELDEEAGVGAENITALGCFDDGDRGEAFYVCTRWSGTPTLRDSEEYERLEWVSPARALLRCVIPAARSALSVLLHEWREERLLG